MPSSPRRRRRPRATRLSSPIASADAISAAGAVLSPMPLPPPAALLLEAGATDGLGTSPKRAARETPTLTLGDELLMATSRWKAAASACRPVATPTAAAAAQASAAAVAEHHPAAAVTRSRPSTHRKSFRDPKPRAASPAPGPATATPSWPMPTAVVEGGVVHKSPPRRSLGTALPTGSAAGLSGEAAGSKSSRRVGHQKPPERAAVLVAGEKLAATSATARQARPDSEPRLGSWARLRQGFAAKDDDDVDGPATRRSKHRAEFVLQREEELQRRAEVYALNRLMRRREESRFEQYERQRMRRARRSAARHAIAEAAGLREDEDWDAELAALAAGPRVRTALTFGRPTAAAWQADAGGREGGFRVRLQLRVIGSSLLEELGDGFDFSARRRRARSPTPKGTVVGSVSPPPAEIGVQIVAIGSAAATGSAAAIGSAEGGREAEGGILSADASAASGEAADATAVDASAAVAEAASEAEPAAEAAAAVAGRAAAAAAAIDGAVAGSAVEGALAVHVPDAEAAVAADGASTAADARGCAEREIGIGIELKTAWAAGGEEEGGCEVRREGASGSVVVEVAAVASQAEAISPPAESPQAESPQAESPPPTSPQAASPAAQRDGVTAEAAEEAAVAAAAVEWAATAVEAAAAVEAAMVDAGLSAASLAHLSPPASAALPLPGEHPPAPMAGGHEHSLAGEAHGLVGETRMDQPSPRGPCCPGWSPPSARRAAAARSDAAARSEAAAIRSGALTPRRLGPSSSAPSAVPRRNHDSQQARGHDGHRATARPHSARAASSGSRAPRGPHHGEPPRGPHMVWSSGGPMSIGNGAPRVFLPNASHLAAASASGTLSARSKAHELHAAALRSFGEATPRSGVAVAARGLLETPRSGIGGAARHVPSSPRPSSAPGTGATSPPHARRGPSPRRISSGGSSPPPKYHSCSSGAGSTPTHPLHSADPSGTHHGRPFSHPHIGRPMNAQSLSASLRLDSRLDPRAGPRSARSHSAFLLESLQSQTEAGGYQPQGFVDRQAYAIADRQAAAVDHRHGLIDRSPTADPNWPSGVASPSPDPNWPGGVVADASSSADRDDAPSASSTSPTPRKHKARGSATPRAAGPEPRSSCGGRSRPVPSIRGDGLQPFMQPLMAMLAAAAPEAQPEGEVTIPPQQPMPNVVALS